MNSSIRASGHSLFDTQDRRLPKFSRRFWAGVPAPGGHTRLNEALCCKRRNPDNSSVHFAAITCPCADAVHRCQKRIHPSVFFMVAQLHFGQLLQRRARVSRHAQCLHSKLVPARLHPLVYGNVVGVLSLSRYLTGTCRADVIDRQGTQTAHRQ